MQLSLHKESSRSARGHQLHDEHEAAAPATPEDDGRKPFRSQFVFVLASIGSAIGFGNVWRFPMLCFEYGGGAFLLPYTLALLLTAIPMVILEFGLGQITQRGHVRLCAQLEPRAEAFGWASVVGTFLIAQFYNALLAYCLVYLLASFRLPQPWADGNATAFFQSVVQATGEPGHGGGLVPELIVGYFLVWLLCYMAVRGGATGIGRLCELLMPAPFVVLIALLIRGLSLPGASDGIRALMTPDWSVLRTRPDIWIVAVGQILFGVSAGLGTLTTYGSYAPRDSDAVSSALIVCFANSAFSLLAAIVVFAYLGHMAQAQGLAVAEVVQGGAALAFEVFPTAVSLMPRPRVWAVAFFVMLLNLGVSSAASMTAPISVAISEALARAPAGSALGSARAKAALVWAVPLGVHAVGFLTGLVYVSRAGLHWVRLADHFVPLFLTISTVLFECWLLVTRYGAARLLREMGAITGGRETALAWPLRFVWTALIPLALCVMLVAQFYNEAANPFAGFPTWFVALGWALGLGPMVLAGVVPCVQAARAARCRVGAVDKARELEVAPA